MKANNNYHNHNHVEGLYKGLRPALMPLVLLALLTCSCLERVDEQTMREREQDLQLRKIEMITANDNNSQSGR